MFGRLKTSTIGVNRVSTVGTRLPKRKAPGFIFTVLSLISTELYALVKPFYTL